VKDGRDPDIQAFFSIYHLPFSIQAIMVHRAVDAPEPVCAYCRRRPVDPVWRPFCCERCKLADLGRWLSGEYIAPGEPLPASPPGDDENG
jgi:uncharacterized protein